jgi:predicted DNA-binding transcriptional regulator AlpA
MDSEATASGASQEGLWDIGDLAAYTKLTRKSAYRLAESADGPPIVRLGKRRIRFVPSAVMAWAKGRME